MKKVIKKISTTASKDVSAVPSALDETTARKSKQPSFYIVGMGGSAGGLEAFEEFFDHMPANCGMAFVLVSHLDPTHKGMMPELLQRHTEMQVFQAADGTKVSPNCVYVIPPNKDLSILRGTLQLLEPSAPRGQRAPINFFFQQLAEDQKEQCACVILSGMGTDGTLGLKAVKEKGGLVFAQDPSEAKYDSMPRSAITTGLVDHIGSASELPNLLLSHSKHTLNLPKDIHPLSETASNSLQNVYVLLRTHTGHDFSLYKKTTILRRIERRMSVHQLDCISKYVQYVQENPHEADLLFKELLIGVTHFFRDPEAFELLKEKISNFLREEKDTSVPFRIWVPGCSTGEEAYSIAIMMKECVDVLKIQDSINIQIFATDLDKDAIDKARQGTYPTSIESDVSPERLQRFFMKESESYRIRKEIREMVVFAPQNVIMDAPFTKLSLLSCRNLLIYLTPELQKKLLPLFHFTLKPNGFLFLGPSETITGHSNIFATVDSNWKIFQRKELLFPQTVALEFPVTMRYPNTGKLQEKESAFHNTEATVPVVTQQILMDSFTPPAVVINNEGNIVYLSGWTGKFLEPAPGKAFMNIHAMARDGLKLELAGAIRSASTRKEDVVLKGLKVQANGGHLLVNVTVKYLTEPESLRGLLMVVFQEVAVPPEAMTTGNSRTSPESEINTHAMHLETELRHTKEHLQITIEEMETTQEELKSTNEELQSTNEELQSTNEEITTSKEEMQSLNEELLSVNTELEKRVSELTESSNDMKNLLDSTDIATIFLDNDLNIKRFTPQATRIINVIPTDTGRPFSDITPKLKYPHIIENARDVLRTLAFKEVEVQTTDEKWYLMRITPYRTYENVIDGVVITFTDITTFKNLEQAQHESQHLLEESRTFAESIIATVREPLLVLDRSLKILTANQSFYETFGLRPRNTQAHLLYELDNGQWNIPALKKLLEDVLQKRTEFHDFAFEHDFAKVGHKAMMLNARKITHEHHGQQLILLAMQEIPKY